MMGELWPLGIQLSYHLSWSLLSLALVVVALVFFLFRRENSHPVDPSASQLG
jgi:cbb3-type cytochrome oxidase subunit 3